MMRTSISRRRFLKRSGLWLPASFCFPHIVRAATVTIVQPAAAGAPSGNSWTHVGSGSSPADSMEYTSVAGNLVVMFTKWENNVTVTGGTYGLQSATIGNVSTHANNDVRCCYAWVLAATGGLASFGLTWSGAPGFTRVVVREFSAAGTHALDGQSAGTSGSASGTGAQSIASGAFSSAVTNGVALGGYGEYSARTVSAEKIGTNDATGTTAESGTEGWYYLFGSQLASVTANATLSSGSDGDPWVMSGICFKST